MRRTDGRTILSTAHGPAKSPPTHFSLGIFPDTKRLRHTGLTWKRVATMISRLVASSGNCARPLNSARRAYLRSQCLLSTVRGSSSTSDASAPSNCDIIKGPSLLRTIVHRPRPSLLFLPGLRSLPFWTVRVMFVFVALFFMLEFTIIESITNSSLLCPMLQSNTTDR